MSAMANISDQCDGFNVHHVAYRPKEWLDETLDLEPLEKAVYADLFMLVCLRHGPVRLELLQKTLGMHARSLNCLLDSLLTKGKIAIKDGLIDHLLARKEIETSVKTIRKLRENGAKGGRKPRENGAQFNENNALGKPEGFHTDSDLDKEGSVEEASASSPALGEPRAASPDPPPKDAIKELLDRALAIFGDNQRSRSFLGKQRKHFGDAAVLHAISRTEIECPFEPVGFFIGCCKDFTAQAGPLFAKKHFSPGDAYIQGAINAALNIPPTAQAYRNLYSGCDTDDALLDSRGDERAARGADAVLAGRA